MMNQQDIEMCVADCLQDDVIESFDLIMHRLNDRDRDSDSWSLARGTAFTDDEVRCAIRRLMAAGMVTPCAETPPSGDCRPVPTEQVGTDFAIESLWFHLEQSGRDAVREWWDSVGRTKFPLEPTE